MSKMKYNPLTGGIDTVDICVTSEDITIDSGSPLAESLDLGMWPEYWKNPDGNPIIPKGTDLDTVLLELFTATKSYAIRWDLSDVRYDYVPSNIEYTPIIEAHGGKWSLVSDKSANLLNARLVAKLVAPYGYFKSLDGNWCNQELTVEIPLSLSKSIVYKKDGTTATRDPGNWKDYPWNGDQSFGSATSISEENVFHGYIGAGIYHDAVYASTNKKRITDYRAKLVLDNKMEVLLRTFTDTKKIHCSHYYFWGYVELGTELVLLKNSDYSHFDKDFLHKVEISPIDGWTYITLPDSIDMSFIIPPDKVLIVAIPRVETSDNKMYVPHYNLPEGVREASWIVSEYICPDGTIVDYTWIMLHNGNFEDTVDLNVTLELE